MNSQIFIYKQNLSLTNLIAPGIGAYAIYMAFTNNGGLAYRGKLILPYPTSSYFFGIVGVLMIIPLIFIFLKSLKGHTIELKKEELKYTKGTLITKEKTISFDEIKGVTYEDDEDNGSSIIIETGKIFNPQFYAKKFKSNSEYALFCESINKIIQK